MRLKQKSLGKPKCNILAPNPLLRSSTMAPICMYVENRELLKIENCVNILHTSNASLTSELLWCHQENSLNASFLL